MIGMKFIRDTGADSMIQDLNTFGWDEITFVSDLILYRTVIREVDLEWREMMDDSHARFVHSHEYQIMALCDNEISELCWDEFSQLLALGVYVVEKNLDRYGSARLSSGLITAREVK